jgi:hypothetical protein
MTASWRSPAPVIIPNACRPLYNVGRRTAAIPLRGAIIAATHVDIVQSMQAVAIHIIIINTELEGGRDSRQPIHTLKKRDANNDAIRYSWLQLTAGSMSVDYCMAGRQRGVAWLIDVFTCTYSLSFSLLQLEIL